MSYDVTKLTQLAHLKSLAEKVAAECATKTELQALSSKVDGLVSAGGEANVLEGVKVNGTALSIAEKMVEILIASGTTNGTISVNNADVAVKGLAALAYKAQVSQSDLDSALNAVIAAKAEQSAVTSLQGEITTLKGSGEGSVKKAIDDAINQFATNVSDDDVVNSFKELVDWAAEHGSEAAEASITEESPAIEDEIPVIEEESPVIEEEISQLSEEEAEEIVEAIEEEIAPPKTPISIPSFTEAVAEDASADDYMAAREARRQEEIAKAFSFIN